MEISYQSCVRKRIGPKNRQTINLIEADLQIVIKVCLKIRRDVLNTNDRVSEHNCGAGIGHAIEDLLLEKTLNADNSIINGKKKSWLIATCLFFIELMSSETIRIKF